MIGEANISECVLSNDPELRGNEDASESFQGTISLIRIVIAFFYIGDVTDLNIGMGYIGLDNFPFLTLSLSESTRTCPSIICWPRIL